MPTTHSVGGTLAPWQRIFLHFWVSRLARNCLVGPKYRSLFEWIFHEFYFVTFFLIFLIDGHKTANKLYEVRYPKIGPQEKIFKNLIWIVDEDAGSPLIISSVCNFWKYAHNCIISFGYFSDNMWFIMSHFGSSLLCRGM